MPTKFICPLLVVKDIASSRRFYEEVLGQEVKNDFGEDVVFKGAFAIHEAKHFAGLTGVDTAEGPRPSHELYFEDDDLSSGEERLKAAGVEFVHPVREQPWKQRCLRCYDPDGHIVEVGESMEAVVRRLHGEGMTAEEITKACKMPVEFVESVTGKRSETA